MVPRHRRQLLGKTLGAAIFGHDRLLGVFSLNTCICSLMIELWVLSKDLPMDFLEPRVKTTEKDVDPELSHGRVVVKDPVDGPCLRGSPAINLLEDRHQLSVVHGQWASILTCVEGSLVQFEDASGIGVVVEGSPDGVPNFLGRREAKKPLH